jgi:hypothetical protein
MCLPATLVWLFRPIQQPSRVFSFFYTCVFDVSDSAGELLVLHSTGFSTTLLWLDRDDKVVLSLADTGLAISRAVCSSSESLVSVVRSSKCQDLLAGLASLGLIGGSLNGDVDCSDMGSACCGTGGVSSLCSVVVTTVTALPSSVVV